MSNMAMLESWNKDDGTVASRSSPHSTLMPSLHYHKFRLHYIPNNISTCASPLQAGDPKAPRDLTTSPPSMLIHTATASIVTGAFSLTRAKTIDRSTAHFTLQYAEIMKGTIGVSLCGMDDGSDMYWMIEYSICDNFGDLVSVHLCDLNLALTALKWNP